MFFFSSNSNFAKTPKLKVVSESKTCIPVAVEKGPDESRTVVETFTLKFLKNL